MGAIVSSGYRKYGFDAYGAKVLKQSDMDYWKDSEEIAAKRGVCFELGEEIEKVEPNFFEILPTIRELRIVNPECDVGMSPAAVKLFRKNNVLIRGAFDTAAERFAEKYGLRFLHIDTVLARAGDYFERGIDIITLCFYDDGSAYINQDERCQGSSAGSTGGGEVDFDLPKDFYMNMSAKDVAGMCWGTCYDKIISNGVLDGIIAKAKEKHGFLRAFKAK